MRDRHWIPTGKSFGRRHQRSANQISLHWNHNNFKRYELIHWQRVRMRLMVSAYGEESGWFIGVIARYLPVMSSLSVESLSNMDPAVLREALPFLSKVNWQLTRFYRRFAVRHCDSFHVLVVSGVDQLTNGWIDSRLERVSKLRHRPTLSRG